MASTINKILILSILLFLTLGKLVIVSPPSLKKFFSDKYGADNIIGIPYSIANYGDIPYGKSIVGQITTPTVLQNCIYQDIPTTNKTKKIILSERNDCKFTQKSLNTQKQGGIMSIIMDNVVENPGRIIMIDDGHGSQIHIPTVMISKEDGQKILQTLKTQPVAISITFDTYKTDTASINMYLDITDRTNFIFLRRFQPFFQMIKNYVKLSINYATVPCKNCLQTDCFYNNQYCKKIIYGWVPNAGQIFIKEQLREYFIFQQNQDKWWDYMDRFDQYCSESTQQGILEQCSVNSMKALEIDSDKILKQVAASFQQQTNPVLQKSSIQRYMGQVMYYPSIIVNNITYRGNLEPYQIKQMICNSLSTYPDECNQQPFQPKSSHIILWIIMSIVGFLILLLFIIFCYRRMVRRQITNNMNKQVNQLVNQYITMYEADKFKGEHYQHQQEDGKEIA